MKRFLALFASAVFILTIAVQFVPTPHASANLGTQPVDPNSVQINFVSSSRLYLTTNGNTFEFIDSDPYDDTRQYVQNISDCESRIRFDNGSFTAPGALSGTADLDYQYVGTVNGSTQCIEDEVDVPLNSTTVVDGGAARRYDAFRINDDTLFMPFYNDGGCSGVGGQSYETRRRSNGVFRTWPQDGPGYNPNIFVRLDENGNYSIDPSNDGVDREESGSWVDTSTSPARQFRKSVCGGSADNSDWNIGIAPAGTSIPEVYRAPLGAYGITFDSNGSPQVPDDLVPPQGISGPSCESSIDNGFGWLICPILDATDTLINLVQNILESKLQVNEDFINNEDLRETWIQVARVSSGLLVIVALVMVISTALGFDFISSYTIKKVLPRLVIGAIGIWLSWTLAATYVDIMNDVGRGIAGLMFAPFETPDRTFQDVDLKYIVSHSFDSTDAGTDLAATAVFSVAFIGFLSGGGGVFALLAAAVPIIGAMLIGFFILALREVVIVFLVVMAPLGVAAWILPNTQKIWKMWSGTFNKLLLMFPLFMAIFAAGKIFALISAESAQGGNNGVVEAIIPMIAYVSPFFFLPFLFKAAGGLFSNLTGIVNNKGKGVFDKVRGGLDAQGKARKANLDRERKLESLQRIGQGQGNLRDRWRTNSFGAFPVPLNKPGTRRMLDRSQERVRLAGLSEFNKEQENLIAGELEELKNTGEINNRGALRAISVDRDQSLVRRQAALVRLAQIGDEEGLRNARASFTRQGASQAETEAWTRFSSGKDYVDAVKDRAPYLVPGRENMFADAPAASPSAATKWSQDSWGQGLTGPHGAAYGTLAAQALSDPRLRGEMGTQTVEWLEQQQHVQAALQAQANQPMPGTVVTPAQGQPQPTTPGQPQPTPVQPAPARAFNRDQIRTMGAENVRAAVDTRGGVEAMHEGDLLSIANEHGTHEVGQAAREELRRRGLLSNNGGQPRNLP